MAGVSITGLNNAITDIVPLWRFELVLPTLQGINGSLTPPDQAFAQKVSIGNQVITDEGEPIANWVKHFPTNSTVDNASITMLESGGQNDHWSATEYWQGWMQLINSSDGNFGLPVNYWQPITVYSLDISGNRIAQFSMIEAWPINIGTIDFDGEASQAFYLSISIVCTRVDMQRL